MSGWSARDEGPKPESLVSTPAPQVKQVGSTVPSPGEGTLPVATSVVQTRDLLQSLATLRDLHPTAVKIALMTRRDRIEESFAQLLGLSPTQVIEMNAALAHARNRLNGLAARNAVVTTSPNGTVIVSVPPFEGGAEVYDELMDSFSSVIGTERNESFKRLFGDQFSVAFQNFGAERRTLTIAETLPEYVDWKDGGFYIKDERQPANGAKITVPIRFKPEHFEFLFPDLQWIEPLVGPAVRAHAGRRP